MVPRVLPAHQYRTCTGVSASLCQIEFEVGLPAPELWSSRTVLLCAVHQLRMNVSSCSCVNWASGPRAYEEPHAGAQAVRAEAVEWRHMRPKVGGKALGGLRGHRGESINLSMGGQLAGLNVSAASLKSRAVVVPNERSSVSWQVMLQRQASRRPTVLQRVARAPPAGRLAPSTAL